MQIILAEHIKDIHTHADTQTHNNYACQRRAKKGNIP